MSKRAKLTIAAEISGILALLVAIKIGINQWNPGTKNANSQKIEPFIRNYFDVLDRRDLDSWSDMFSDDIARFFGLHNPSIAEILENQRRSYDTYKYDTISINWESLKVVKANTDYLATFDLNYKRKKIKMIIIKILI